MVILAPPIKKNLAHHSSGDFAFFRTLWTLTPDYYVSEPSSLKIWGPSPASQHNLAICTLPVVACIPQGRIVTYILHHPAAYGHPYIYFRNQSPPGTASSSNGYEVAFYPTFAKLVRVINNSGTTIGDTYYQGVTMGSDIWYRVRLTWWNDGPTNLTLRVEVFIDGAWVITDPDLHDPNNQWKLSGTNRIGVGCVTYYGGPTTNYVCHDDLEVYAPAP